MKEAQTQKSPPFKLVTVNRILLVLVILLAFASGYFQAKWTTEQKKYSELEQLYASLQAETQGLEVEEVAE